MPIFVGGVLIEGGRNDRFTGEPLSVLPVCTQQSKLLLTLLER